MPHDTPPWLDGDVCCGKSRVIAAYLTTAAHAKMRKQWLCTKARE
jgi:hypothetical protein